MFSLICVKRALTSYKTVWSVLHNQEKSAFFEDVESLAIENKKDQVCGQVKLKNCRKLNFTVNQIEKERAFSLDFHFPLAVLTLRYMAKPLRAGACEVAVYSQFSGVLGFVYKLFLKSWVAQTINKYVEKLLEVCEQQEIFLEKQDTLNRKAVVQVKQKEKARSIN